MTFAARTAVTMGNSKQNTKIYRYIESKRATKSGSEKEEKKREPQYLRVFYALCSSL